MTDADRLEGLVSPARFAVFVNACGGDRERAVALYHWDAELSGALHVDLGYVEIALRNRMHNALSEHHSRLRRRPAGTEWFDGPSWVRHHWFDRAGQTAIDGARRVARHWPPHASRPDAVVAALGFGFWRYLVTARYEQSFWIPILDQAFASVPGSTASARRIAVDARLRVLVRLRNRVAHHEPIFRAAVLLGSGGRQLSYPIEQQFAMLAEIARWIDPATLAGKVGGSASAAILASRQSWRSN